MISGIQQCVDEFDIKNKDLIEYLRTSIYLIYTRCLSVWSRPHIGQGNSDRFSRFHWFFFTQFKNCEAMTTLICWFSSQLFHAEHVCFMSAIGETRGRINLVRETPSICSPQRLIRSLREQNILLKNIQLKSIQLKTREQSLKEMVVFDAEVERLCISLLGLIWNWFSCQSFGQTWNLQTTKTTFFSLSLSKNIVNWDLGHWEHNFTLFCDIAFWTEYGLFKVGSFGCYTIHLDFLSGMNASCYDHNLRS